MHTCKTPAQNYTHAAVYCSDGINNNSIRIKNYLSF